MNRIISKWIFAKGGTRSFTTTRRPLVPPGPWDLDMLIIPETHWQGAINIERCLSRHKILNIEFKKTRPPELLDLLLDDDSPTGGQIGQFIKEHARFINPPGAPFTFVDVDQFMWNYHPRTLVVIVGSFMFRRRAKATAAARGRDGSKEGSRGHDATHAWVYDRYGHWAMEMVTVIRTATATTTLSMRRSSQIFPKRLPLSIPARRFSTERAAVQKHFL
ncbi:MAG: hypothetical protein CM1200mP29_01160 [Verrucomicrobiota bacterium]|nr:MAG: hypothetical protein CM1200mP29_01160 [Verrucomicrobiota bacterium]